MASPRCSVARRRDSPIPSRTHRRGRSGGRRDHPLWRSSRFSSRCAAVLDAGTAVIIGSGISFGLGTVYEIATAPMSARAFNRKHARQLAVTPVIGREPGLAIGGTF